MARRQRGRHANGDSRSLARSAESPLSRDDPGDSAFHIRVTLDLIRPREVTYAALLAKGEHFRLSLRKRVRLRYRGQLVV